MKNVSIKQHVNVKSIPTGYMEDNVVLEQLNNLADQLVLQDQEVDINSIYDSLNNW